MWQLGPLGHRRVEPELFDRLVVEQVVELAAELLAEFLGTRMHKLPRKRFDRHERLDCVVDIPFDTFVGMGIVVAERIVKCIVVDKAVGNWQVAVVVVVQELGVLVSSSRRIAVVETES